MSRFSSITWFVSKTWVGIVSVKVIAGDYSRKILLKHSTTVFMMEPLANPISEDTSINSNGCTPVSESARGDDDAILNSAFKAAIDRYRQQPPLFERFIRQSSPPPARVRPPTGALCVRSAETAAQYSVH